MSQSDQIEAFVVTNGRKTFDYVLGSINEQSLQMKITILRDMKWVDALNEINLLATCPFYIRIDDDMILHKFTAEYMLQKIKKSSLNSAFYMCCLYEPSTNKVVRGIKTYNTNIAQKIGYEADRFGKIDKIFLKKCIKKKYKINFDKSIVGVHATSDLSDEQKYQQLWIGNSPKQYVRDIVKSPYSIEEQNKMRGKSIMKMNAKRSTNFYNFALSKAAK